MTEAQIVEALQQVVIDCKILEDTDYHSVSLRGELYKLGYDEENADACIRYAHKGGFTHCIDPMFPSKSHEDGSDEPTPSFACYWGPDQLRSRLEWFLPRNFG